MASASIISKANLIQWHKAAGQPAEVPLVPSARSAKEEAIVLLQVGAEVEHALLLQYLFAGYSLRTDAAEPADWQNTFQEIAQQEMAHLITVQNLLSALGAPMHFDREDFPLHPTLYPFPVKLERVSKQSLAKYVAAEMPPMDQIPPETQDEVKAILLEANGAAHEDVQRVGRIYARVYWLFRKFDAAAAGEPWPDVPVAEGAPHWHIEDSDLATESAAAGLSTPADWGIAGGFPPGMNVDATLPRSEALQAIHRIAAQGEGPASQADSHFERFLNLYRAFNSFQGDAVIPVGTNPSTTQDAAAGGAPENRTPITEPAALQRARLLDVRYEILLMCLILGTREPKNGADNARTIAVGASLGAMGIVAAQAGTLVTLPAQPGGATMAGPPFELLHGPLPQEPLTQWVRLKQLIAKSDRILTALQEGTFDGAELRALIDARIEALVNTPLPD